MSLNQKYTWQDFLKAHPEHKEKKTKRTSAEGKKAFDAAYKAFIKKYLAERIERLGKDIERSKKRRDDKVAKLKELRKAKKNPKAKLAQLKVGRADGGIARFTKQIEKTKNVQKSF